MSLVLHAVAGPSDQLQECLVDESRRVQGVVVLPPLALPVCQEAELVVQQREELVDGRFIAVPQFRKQSRDGLLTGVLAQDRLRESGRRGSAAAKAEEAGTEARKQNIRAHDCRLNAPERTRRSSMTLPGMRTV